MSITQQQAGPESISDYIFFFLKESCQHDLSVSLFDWISAFRWVTGLLDLSWWFLDAWSHIAPGDMIPCYGPNQP